MDNRITEQTIGFINAMPGSQVYYYSALAPSILVNEQAIPEVHYQIFRSSATAQPTTYYAILSLQTQLNSSMAAAQAAARDNPDIPPDATLLPLQIIASTATLCIPQAMPQLLNHTSLGNNQFCYIMAALTDANDIQRIVALLQQPESAPIAVSYKIDYLQQLPPSTFELDAQWDQVYEYLKISFGFNALIFSFNIDDISETLISKKLVTIKARNTNPDHYMRQATAELSTILTCEFFTPVFGQIKTAPAPKFGFQLQNISVKDIDKRTLSARITETTVVRRSLYPQALFATLVSQSHYDAIDVVSYHELQDDFFAYRTIKVQLLTPELDENIQLVALNLTYGTTRSPLVFSRNNMAAKTFHVSAIIDPVTKKMSWPVEYQFTLYFNHPVGGVMSASSAILSTSLTEIFLDIESLYSRYHFVIATEKKFNWAWYTSILVNITCTHIENKENSTSKNFHITEKKPSEEYSVMLPDPECYNFSVIKEYSTRTNTPHIPVRLDQPTSQDVSISSRLYKQRTLKIIPVFDWEKITQVLVNVTYCYNQFSMSSLKEAFYFSENQSEPELFSADQPDPTLLFINLDIMIIDNDGGVENKKLITDEEQIDITN
ncbi:MULTISPECIES: hypothetical protein [Yersinia]|uniref:hypothetical protein n=1 Tax=Yersinia TaxID=629 RepID=UPI0005E208C3|nr:MULTISPECIES: hypothetical protein [Yersinia]ARB83195.1 hypothetical protein A6J67_03210 [Yersinia sp. FDAARGOS_228]AVL36949.1 hypothetical protein CEQ36_15940 [Yersinia intermedia]CND98153.1 Uncharacterised protein [Yersinia intermedia]